MTKYLKAIKGFQVYVNEARGVDVFESANLLASSAGGRRELVGARLVCMDRAPLLLLSDSARG